MEMTGSGSKLSANCPPDFEDSFFSNARLIDFKESNWLIRHCQNLS